MGVQCWNTSQKKRDKFHYPKQFKTFSVWWQIFVVRKFVNFTMSPEFLLQKFVKNHNWKSFISMPCFIKTANFHYHLYVLTIQYSHAQLQRFWIWLRQFQYNETYKYCIPQIHYTKQGNKIISCYNNNLNVSYIKEDFHAPQETK